MYGADLLALLLRGGSFTKEASKSLVSCLWNLTGLTAVTSSSDPGPAFYRAESAQARDLAVLAVRTQRKSSGWGHCLCNCPQLIWIMLRRSPNATVLIHRVQNFRVLDALAGSGIRAARYLQQMRCSGAVTA